MPLDAATNTSTPVLNLVQEQGSQSVRNPACSAPHRQVNLAGVDLNLLVALEALLQERNVTISAGRVGLSQPAMSRALGRLRALFNDDLLVRSTAGFVLTRRAEQLASELPSVMAALRTLLGRSSPTVQGQRAVLTVAMPDHQSLVMLPRLLDRLRVRAPQMELVTQSLLTGTARRLEAGEVDLAVGCIKEAASGFYRRTLYTDRFVCLVRNGHPILAETWNADRFAALQHAVIASPAEEGFAQVYDTLSDLQFLGRDTLMVPNASSAPFIIAETDIALILPLRAARSAAAHLPLTVLEVPIHLPSYEVALLWHERSHRDTDCIQLRAEIAAVSLAAVQSGERAPGTA